MSHEFDPTQRPTGFGVRDHLQALLFEEPLKNSGMIVGLLRALADNVIGDPNNPRYGFVISKYTSHAALAILTGTSERTVQRGLHLMDDLNWIERKPQYRQNNRIPDEIYLSFLHFVIPPEEDHSVPDNLSGTRQVVTTPPDQMSPPPCQVVTTPPDQMAARIEEGFKKGKNSEERAERESSLLDQGQTQTTPRATGVARPPEGAEAEDEEAGESPGAMEPGLEEIEEDLSLPIWYRWKSYPGGPDWFSRQTLRSEFRPDGKSHGEMKAYWLSETEHLAALAELEAAA